MSTQVYENFIKTTHEPVASGTEADTTVLDGITEGLANALHVYYTPVLIILGSAGNLYCIFIFYSSKLRLQSTSQYLSALALSDTVFLLQLLPPWMNTVQLTSIFIQIGYCQIFEYTSYVTCCLSAWLVVAFTVERFVAVVYPLRRNVLSTATRARRVIVALVAAALLLNVPVLRFAVPSRNDCNVDSDYLDHAARFNLIDTALSFTVPLAVITVLNTWIMVGVYRLERARHHLMKAERQAWRGRGRRPPAPEPCPRPRPQHRITRMLLIISSVFVGLNMPAYTLRILGYVYDMGAGEHGGRWAALQQLALVCFNTNFGINFILYCLSGQNFRRALSQSTPWLRLRGRHVVVIRRASSPPARVSSISTSIVSHCTEATSNGSSVSVVPPSARRPPADPVLKRLDFRHQRAAGRDPPPPRPARHRDAAPTHSVPGNRQCHLIRTTRVAFGGGPEVKN